MTNRTAGILAIPLWQDELVLAAHPEYLKILPKKPSVSELIKYPFIIRDENSGTTRTFLKHIYQYGYTKEALNIVLNLGGNEALKSAIVHNIGIGFVSRLAIQTELQNNQLIIVEVPELKIARQFYAIHSAWKILEFLNQ